MKILKTIKMLYWILTIYILSSLLVTNLNLIDIFPSILLMWIIYFIFKKGYKKEKIMIVSQKNFFIKKNKFITFLFVFVSSLSLVKFYTGQNFYQVFNNLRKGISVYYVYQDYFKNSNLAIMNLKKIPMIILNFLLNFIFYYSLIIYNFFHKRINLKEKLFLIGIIFSFIYFGISRGTSFELFEAVLFYMYILLLKVKKHNIKINLKIIIFILIGVLFFLVGIKNRNVVGLPPIDGFMNTKRYDSSKFVVNIFPNISLIIYQLFGYFGYGFYYTSLLFNEILFLDINMFFVSLIPLGFKIKGINNIKLIIENYIDPGAHWVPDIIKGINNLGILGLLLFIYFMGVYIKKINRLKLTPIIILTNFLCILQMFSFPIGNFLIASSSNKLIVLFCFLVTLIKLKKDRKKRRK